MGGSLGGSHTGLTVLTGLVSKGELSEVPADHVELDFHIVEALSVVDSHIVTDHLGHDNGVAEVSLDGNGLLSGLSVLLALLALGVEADVFVLDLCVAE
jgi:hypothetical protein